MSPSKVSNVIDLVPESPTSWLIYHYCHVSVTDFSVADISAADSEQSTNCWHHCLTSESHEVNIFVDLLVGFLTSMVHCMSGISFGCIIWCPSAFTSLPSLESCPHVFIPPPGFTMPTVWPSCATYLLSCLEQFHLDVVPDILSGPISYTCRCAHMQVEDLLEMIACLRVFKLPNFEARGELALGFWRHINPHVTYKKLMLQSYFLTRDHFYICDKFAHGPAEKDEVSLCGYVSRLVLLRARRNEKEMKVKPATSFKLLTIFIHKKVRQDSKQKNVNKQYLSSLCHKVLLK